MKRFMLLTMVIGLSGMIWASSEQAISSISLDFILQDQTVIGTGPVSVDVVISGLQAGIDEIVSGFDLSVSFDDSLLSATGVLFSNFLGDPGVPEVFQNTILDPGIVRFAALSLFTDLFTEDFTDLFTEDDLAALQSDTFTLATLNFQTMGGIGISDLVFESMVGSEVIGRDNDEESPLFLSFGPDGSIRIISAAVPEPSTWLLFGTGLMALAYYRGRRKTLTS